MEAMFNLFRFGSSKTMGDDTKEDALKWDSLWTEVNIWRRNKKSQKLGLPMLKKSISKAQLMVVKRARKLLENHMLIHD